MCQEQWQVKKDSQPSKDLYRLVGREICNINRAIISVHQREYSGDTGKRREKGFTGNLNWDTKDVQELASGRQRHGHSGDVQKHNDLIAEYLGHKIKVAGVGCGWGHLWRHVEGTRAKAFILHSFLWEIMGIQSRPVAAPPGASTAGELDKAGGKGSEVQ